MAASRPSTSFGLDSFKAIEMRIYQINLAILAALLLFIKAEVNAQPVQDRLEPNAMLNEENMKIPPLTAVDLIQNIKYCVDNDLFLTDEFFIEENLIRFANGHAVENLGDNKNYFMAKGINVEGVSGGISFVREYKDGEKAGGLILHFNSPFINADYLIKIFGPFQTATDPYRNYNPVHPGFVTRKTHQYGNMEMHYVLTGKKSKTEIISFTQGDGSISRVNIKQTGE
jgi:hypothetical protein